MAKQFSIYHTDNKDVNFPKAIEELRVEITLVDEAGASMFGLLNTGKVFGTVVGYLSKEFEYNATGNYSNVFDVKSGASLLKNIIEDEAQANIANYGYLTKKMYHNGDSPTIDISFRCYAGAKSDNYNIQDGIVNPVLVANVLINATLPRVGKHGLLNFTSIHNLKNSESPAATVAKPISRFLDTVTGTDGATLGNLGPGLVSDVGAAWDVISDTNITDLISKKPPVCNVKIGNIFEKSMMVVKSVSVKFSKEFMKEGVPLYADFDVTLQSLFNSSSLESGTDANTEKIFGSGLNGNTKNGSRVSFDYDTSTQPPIPVVKTAATSTATMNRTAGPNDKKQIAPGSRSVR